MGRLIFILVMAACCYGQIDDEDYGNVQLLVAHVRYEHNAIKQLIKSEQSVFHWEFVSFSRFPQIPGKQCPYFSGEHNYRFVEGYGNVVYKINDSLYYVGIRYYYTTKSKDSTEVDTSYYKITAYRGVNTGWKRVFDVMTLKCHYDEIIQQTGRKNY